MADVSIIIVNYNTGDLLRQCIASIYQHTRGIEFEIIVSDNGSHDGSIAMLQGDFPEVILVEIGKNLGFGAANNRGIKKASGDFVFFLNSDTVLLNNAVKLFYDYWRACEKPEEIGALGCNLLNRDHAVTRSSGPFFNLFLDLRHYAYEYLSLVLLSLGIISKKLRRRADRILGEVDIIIGAALFMANNADALFDEYFFLYHEEADLEFRLAQKGKKRILIEGPLIVHFEGGSNKIKKRFGDFYSFSAIQDYLSKVKYYRKHIRNPVHRVLLKTAICMLWSFPPLVPGTRRYFRELWRT
jgi:GT2 family glycosyltransferase